MEELLTAEELAQEVRISPQTITRWCRSGELDAERIGKKWRISRTAWNKFKQEHKEKSKKASGLALAC